MPVYKDLDDLAGCIFGKEYQVESEVAKDTKGLGSTQLRFKITPIDKNVGNQDSQQVFAKQNDMESQVYKLLHVVEKESIMYDRIIPCVIKFLSERDSQLCSDVRLLFPHYYGRGSVSNNHIFLFQDLFHTHGEKFKVNASDTFHDEAHVHLVMASLAKFHGVFHAMKNIGGFDFKDEYPILAEDYLLEQTSFDLVAPFYNGEFHKAWEILQVVLHCYSSKCFNMVKSKLVLPDNHVYNIQKALEKLKFLVGDPLQLMKKIRQRENADTSILIHGDFHPMNIAMSDSKIKFFDYQLIRYSDGLSDVNQYLCQGTTPQQRSKNLTSYLETYHKTLTETCKILGMSGSPYGDTAGFMLEYRKFSPLQIPYGFGMLIWKFVTDFKVYEELANLLKDLECCTASDKSIPHENIITCIDKLGPKIWVAIQILFEFVIEIEDNGILDQI